MRREDLLMLYTTGTDYSDFLESNSGFYKEGILSFKSNIAFNDHLIDEIKAMGDVKYFLAVAEPWCENCVIHVTMLEVASTINNNINYRIVAQTEFEDLSASVKEIDVRAIPLIIELSSSGEILATYSEKPEVLRKLETGSPVMRTAMKKKYKEGGLAEEIVREILKI